jgi:signal transduction histidine kinase
MRILIVDDDAIFRTLAEKKMTDAGAETVLAEDGASGWALAESQTFDLAMIDLGLPDMDGFDLIERLRQLPHARRTPLIVVTGREDSEAIDRAYAVGATSFLTKPINWKLFEHQVVFVLRSNALEREAHQARICAQAESRIKDQVTSRLSHSMRPLVRQLTRSAEKIAVLSSRLPQAARISEDASNLVDDAMRLEEDLNSMIVLTRAISGFLELDERRCSVTEIVAEVARRVQPLAKDRDIAVEAELPAHDVEIEADQEKLTRALKCLAENALRFSPARTSVVLAARPIDDGSLHLCVEDDGPGIPADLLAQLLLPLTGDGTEAETRHLSGLGIAVSKLIAEGHGGQLTIRSAIDRGTTAGIHLPTERVLTRRRQVA